MNNFNLKIVDLFVLALYFDFQTNQEFNTLIENKKCHKVISTSWMKLNRKVEENKTSTI